MWNGYDASLFNSFGVQKCGIENLEIAWPAKVPSRVLLAAKTLFSLKTGTPSNRTIQY